MNARSAQLHAGGDVDVAHGGAAGDAVEAVEGEDVPLVDAGEELGQPGWGGEVRGQRRIAMHEAGIAARVGCQ